LEILYNIAMSF